MKAAIEVTDSAKAWISQRCDQGTRLLGIRINSKGCSGNSYEYFISSVADAGRFDEVITWEGGGVLIEAASVMKVLGSTLDLESNDMQQHLVWHNPNSTNHCGCGESFSIKQ